MSERRERGRSGPARRAESENERGDARLLATLERAREQGFLGPRPIEAHLEHALGFVDLICRRDARPDSILDLGTGGGVPGLVLADRFPVAVALLEVSARRSDFLSTVIAEFEWSGRVEVIAARGEEAGHRPELRERFAMVTARSFAEPAVTAEIGAPLLRRGGVLVVSEPPEPSDERWQGPLEELGLRAPVMHEVCGAHFVSIEKFGPTPARYPRAVGRPGKRPLW